MKITYSAPFSIPFCGEDTALYGKPVLIAACDKRVTLVLNDNENKKNTDSFLLYIDKTVRSYLKKSKKINNTTHYTVDITSDISLYNSFTYHSAVLVAATATFFEFYTFQKPTLEEINTLSYQIHKSFFKLSLGFYTSCSCFGGIQYYRKEFEFLKSLSKLNFKLPEKIQNNLFISFQSQNSISPQEAVENIKKMYNQNPIQTEKLFNEIEKTTKRLVIAIAQENTKSFEQNLAKAHELERIGGGKGLSDDIKVVYSHQKENLTPFILSETGLKRH